MALLLPTQAYALAMNAPNPCQRCGGRGTLLSFAVVLLVFYCACASSRICHRLRSRDGTRYARADQHMLKPDLTIR